MSATNSGYVIRTKMADALIQARKECIQQGRNPGRIGRHILTAETRGLGVKFVKKSSPAESAVLMAA